MAENPTYYYHSNIKNLIIGFLDIFNEFNIKRWDTEKTITNTIKTPILYGPIERSTYVNNKGESVSRHLRLPLIHVSLKGFEIDTARAFAMKSLHVINKSKTPLYDDGTLYDTLRPFPYNFTFQMTILAKYEEDLMQLVEQVVPLFNYHRVMKMRHPVYHDQTISNWIKISSGPNFDFNTKYSAEERRDILTAPITFQVEGWLVREPYGGADVTIKTIIENFYNKNQLSAYKHLITHTILGDDTISIIEWTEIDGETVPVVGDEILGSGYSFTSEVLEVLDTGELIVQFPTSDRKYEKDEILSVSGVNKGTVLTCNLYKDQELTETSVDE